MAEPMITDELVDEVARDLRERYALDADGVRLLGARLAGAPADAEPAATLAFVERFLAEHPDTFDRLSR